MSQASGSMSRRTFLSGAVGGIGAVGLLGRIPSEGRGTVRADSSGDNWMQHRADSGHSARVPNGVGPIGEIEEAWIKKEDYFHDGVAVVGETVYSGGHALNAFNAKNGNEIWSFKPTIPDHDYPDGRPVPDVGQPAVMGDTVYAHVEFAVFDGGNAYDSAIIACDVNSGELRWRYDTPGGVTADEFNTVTAAGGTVVTSVSPRDGYAERIVLAFAADGTERWRTTIEEMPPGPLPVTDGRVYVPNGAGVRALDLNTGETVWDVLPRVRFAPAAPPVVSDGTLFVAERGNPGATLIALDAKSGSEHWRKAFQPDANSPPFTIGAADSDSIYIDVGENSELIALDRSNGNERWRTIIEQPEGRRGFVSELGFALVGGLLYRGSAAFNPSDGSMVWKHPLKPVGGGGFHLSAVAGGRVYLHGDQLIALSGKTNEITETPTETKTRTVNKTQTQTKRQTQTQTRTQTGTATRTTTRTTIGTQTETQETPPASSPPTTTESSSAGIDGEMITWGLGIGALSTVAGAGIGAWYYLTNN